MDSETILLIYKRDKLFKKYRKFSLETGEDHVHSAKMASQKAISKEKNLIFKRKTKGMLMTLRTYGKFLCP